MLTFAVLFLPYAAFAFESPPNDGFMTDAVGLLAPSEEVDIESRLAAYQRETSNEIAIVIVPSLDGDDIADAAVQLGREWGIGSEKNNGILILMDYGNRDIFIATGYGLEGAVPDIVAKGIIENDIAPFTREGQYYEGLVAAIDALQKHIGGEYTAERYTAAESPGLGSIAIFLLFVILNGGAAILGHSRSWWLGGVLGGIFGIILAVLYTWWLSIPVLIVAGLLFDFVVSRMSRNGRGRFGGRGGPWGGGGLGGRGGGGGFGGFGGGSFGGGGARGKF